MANGWLNSPLTRTWWTKRRIIVATTGIFCTLIFFGHASGQAGRLYEHAFPTPTIEEPKPKKVDNRLPGPPPEYKLYREWEQNLPQHNLDLPYPEGRTGRYVKFSNQIQGLGWNNVLNELIFNTHTAWAANRGYVFSDFIWKPEYYPWQNDQETGVGWTSDFPRTPLSALIAGPTAGAPWEDGDNAPRSISESYWYKVCPEEDIHVIWSDDGKAGYGDKPGDVVMKHWIELIRDAPKRCVEVKGGPSGSDSFSQTYDLWLLGTDRINSMWDFLKDGAPSRLWKTSPLVNFALERNANLFFPGGPHHGNAPLVKDPYESMMALHIRRGDYKDACEGLWKYRSTFYGFTQLDWLPDRFKLPGDHLPEEESHKLVLDRCFPSLDLIVQKVRQAKKDYIDAGEKLGEKRHLQIIYLLTNANDEFVNEFKAVLSAEGWRVIATSKDLKFDDEQIGVAMAVDMDIARRAALFIGNGWSSFTANILHRRLLDGKTPIANRFW